MNLRRTAAMSRKEFTQIRRDPRSLVIALFLPLVQILLLGYGARLDANHIPVYVFDQESSQDSQALLKAFQASPYFDLVKVVKNYRALVSAIDADQCKLGIVIPWDFSQRLDDAGRTEVQALVDGTDDNSAQLADGYAQAVVETYANGVQLDWFARHGLSAQAASPLGISMSSLRRRVMFEMEPMMCICAAEPWVSKPMSTSLKVSAAALAPSVSFSTPPVSRASSMQALPTSNK